MENKNQKVAKTNNLAEGVTETENKIRTLDVLGYKINSNSCSALDYNLYLKRFGEYVKHTGSEQGFTLSMNHISIWELLDDAISTEIHQEVDTNQVWLVIETEEYKVSFKIPKEVSN